ncbi:radical SAM protein [Clostridium sp. 'White wine YQ']|uniref:radical SAM protein n=1 Tax=Clostridium sp. 'White wine YQ' TaxID=3027474 RepID=UPI002366CFC0|nr:radical SAM protein [Clostridium sp. 'White wine YQ']MDD7792763.1 hypothetical protein [Clostridium sp. 'White wine YQ']
MVSLDSSFTIEKFRTLKDELKKKSEIIRSAREGNLGNFEGEYSELSKNEQGKYIIPNGCLAVIDNLHTLNKLIFNINNNEKIYLLEDFLLDDRFKVFICRNKVELMINVTNKCIEKCKYCKQQCNSSKSISKKLALKTLDTFFLKMQRFNQNKVINKYIITFYGGDPLLKFQEIKTIMNYCNLKFQNEISFNIITNGNLLTEENVRFLLIHNSKIFVKFYGPESNYKRYVSEENKNEYNSILLNLKKCKEVYPYGDIGIIVPYDFRTDLKETCEFFEKQNLHKVILTANICNRTSEEFEKMDQCAIDDHLNQIWSLYEELISKKNETKYISSFLKSLFNSTYN